MTIHKAIARAWTDADYKARLLSDPHAALAEHGIKVRDGIKVKAVEDTRDTKHLVLPVAPENASELSKEELEKAAVQSSGAFRKASTFPIVSSSNRPSSRAQAMTSHHVANA